MKATAQSPRIIPQSPSKTVSKIANSPRIVPQSPAKNVPSVMNSPRIVPQSPSKNVSSVMNSPRIVPQSPESPNLNIIGAMNSPRIVPQVLHSPKIRKTSTEEQKIFNIKQYYNSFLKDWISDYNAYTIDNKECDVEVVDPSILKDYNWIYDNYEHSTKIFGRRIDVMAKSNIDYNFNYKVGKTVMCEEFVVPIKIYKQFVPVVEFYFECWSDLGLPEKQDQVIDAEEPVTIPITYPWEIKTPSLIIPKIGIPKNKPIPKIISRETGNLWVAGWETTKESSKKIQFGEFFRETFELSSLGDSVTYDFIYKSFNKYIKSTITKGDFSFLIRSYIHDYHNASIIEKKTKHCIVFTGLKLRQ